MCGLWQKPGVWSAAVPAVEVVSESEAATNDSPNFKSFTCLTGLNPQNPKVEIGSWLLWDNGGAPVETV